MTFRAEPSEATRLAPFIRGNDGPIINEWLTFARSRTPASDSMTDDALRDHISAILTFVADDLESHQTGFQQLKKAQGEGPKQASNSKSAAAIHAELRLLGGFNIDQMVSEYRALRASVIKLWRNERNSETSEIDLNDLIRFNEAIDQATTESITRYNAIAAQSQNLFLGILGHDLRTPVGAAKMSAMLMLQTAGLTEEQKRILSQIVACMSRADVIMTDLIDLTRIQVGFEMPVTKQTLDMADLGRELIAEMRAFYPDKVIDLKVSGDTRGDWDKTRMGQVLTNLIGNGIMHGLRDTPVTVAIAGDVDEITLSVHNKGKPIPESEMGKIFESLVRGQDRDAATAGVHLGLGLFIAKRIIDEHRGTVEVASCEQSGTTFSVKLPRY